MRAKPIRRSPYQKLLLKEMQGFWADPNPKTRTIRKPWRVECIKGTLYLRWTGSVLKREIEARQYPIAPFLDFLEEHGLYFEFDKLCNLKGFEYIKSYSGAFGPNTLLINLKIPRESS